MLGDLMGIAARAAEAARQMPGVRETTEFARQVPGVREAEQLAGELEQVAVREVRELLDAIDGAQPRAIEGTYRTGELPSGPEPEVSWAGTAGTGDGGADRARPRGGGRAAALLAELLDRSVDQTRSQARQTLFERTLRQLVPDEARILAALADGSAYPTVDLVVRNPVGTVRQRVLQNVSTVGRSAGVALPDEVPVYLTHLRSLGLVDLGPEDPALSDRYEILMTEEVVRRAQADAKGGGPEGQGGGKGRVGRGNTLRALRGTVRLSALGWQLWQACNPEYSEPAMIIAPEP